MLSNVQNSKRFRRDTFCASLHAFVTPLGTFLQHLCLFDLLFRSEQHIKEMEQLTERSPRELYKRGEDFDSIYLSHVS